VCAKGEVLKLTGDAAGRKGEMCEVSRKVFEGTA
jgi:hypothetical protein